MASLTYKTNFGLLFSFSFPFLSLLVTKKAAEKFKKKLTKTHEKKNTKMTPSRDNNNRKTV